MNRNIFCKLCFMPSTRPRITFDKNGICNGCNYNNVRKEITDWDLKKNELKLIVEKSKNNHTNDTYDCVIGWSGGKDSSAVALHLKKDLNLNPLLVTFSPLIDTFEGMQNRKNLLEKGFDSILIAPSIEVSKYLSKRFLIERGDPKIHWNAGINAATINIASALKIPIVFYSEHGESEYGGNILNEESRIKRTYDEILENQIGDDPENWTDDYVSLKNLEPYRISQNKISKLEILYFAHYFPWDVVNNYEYVNQEINFVKNSRGRTYGTFTDFDSLDDTMDDLYYYMQFIKFGFGRCLRDCSRQIQKGRLKKEEAFDLINKFDGEYPKDSIPKILDFLDINERDFRKIIDMHRRKDVWRLNSNKWELINKVSMA